MITSTLNRFIAASGLVNLADGVAMVAWAWLASLLTRDPLLVATVPVLLRLPWVVCTIPAGLITDRVDRRRLILWMDILRAAVFAVLAAALVISAPLPAPDAGVARPGLFALLLVAATLVGTAEVFRDNTAQTLLPSIVPSEQLERANGRLWSVELVGNALLGPALGAFLIAYATAAPFVLNTAAYVLAFCLLAKLKGQFRAPSPKARNWRAEIMEGVRYLRNSPLLMTLALLTGFANLFYEMVMIGLVLHVQENLALGAQAFGLILAAGAIGGIVGGWVGDRVVARFGPRFTAQIMLALSVPAFVGIVWAQSAMTLAAVLMAHNFIALIWNTVAVSYRQRVIPNQMLGRVNSLYRLFAWGMMPVGILLSGVVVAVAETAIARDLALMAPFVVASFGNAVLAILGWRALARYWPRSTAT